MVRGKGAGEQGEYLLFCRERDPAMEQWNGYRAGLEGACERYGADDAFPVSDIDDILPGLIENRERVRVPAADGAVDEVTIGLPMPGIVEAQKGAARGAAALFQEERLGAGHVRLEAAQEDDTRRLAGAAHIGDGGAVRALDHALIGLARQIRIHHG